MATSLSLVLEHLNDEQLSFIIDNIVSQLKNNSQDADQSAYIDTFCEILKKNTSSKNSLSSTAYEYVIKILNFEDPADHFESILKLSLQLDDLPEKIIQYVIEKLQIFITSNPSLFSGKVLAKVNYSTQSFETDYDLSQLNIHNLLIFTEWYLIHNEEFANNLNSSTLNDLCYIYLTNEILEISKSASKVLKWRIPSICKSDESIDFLWEIIFLLEESGDKTEISYGYVLWLRFFNYFKPESLKLNAKFQKKISEEKYWYFLRDGLISITHEHKKFALTLVQASVQSLATNLSLPVINWNVAKEDQFIESWKRFCTLYEILGIDAAMNQAQAATNDLLRIFSPTSDIPVPFALTILSVSFRASQDRIKKFALNLAFTLPKQSLSLFKYDFKFISHVFLPFTMKSSHFSVVKDANGFYVCEFGDNISNFICNCVDSLDDKNEISKLVGLIFDVISENRLTFGIARIYIIWGVLKGLEKKSFKPLNSNVLDLLSSLFETVAEGDISKTVLQTVHLRILLQIDASTLNLRSYIQAIVYFIQMNGYSQYRDDEEFFLDYFNTNFSKKDFIELLTNKNVYLTPEAFVVVSSHLLSNNYKASEISPSLLSHPSCNEIIIQMASSRLNFKEMWGEPLIVSCVERLVNDMVIGSKKLSISIYNNCEQLFQNVILFSNEFWMSMKLEPLYSNICEKLTKVDNIEEANYYIAQFKFLTVCFPRCIYNEDFDITHDSLVTFLNNSLKHIPKGSDTTFYKSKDELNSYILKNITSLLKVNVYTDDVRNSILLLANDVVSMSEYNTHLANVGMMTSLLNELTNKTAITINEANLLVNTLDLLWSDLIRDRLILNQRDLHQAFIKLALHPKLLVCSIDDEDLANSLFDILDEIITNSAGRKGLLPHLFRSISAYQVHSQEDFEKTFWLAKLLVKGAFLFQSELNIFQLDCIISENFDKQLNISGESLYTRVYGEPEVSYHVSIFAIVGSIKTENFATTIWDYIFNNDDLFRLLNPKKRTDREEQWKRIQLLSLLVSVVDLTEISKLLRYMKTMLLPRLFNEASPLCRTYIEWLLCLTIQRIPDFREAVFDALKPGVESQQPLVMVGFERISMLLSMQLNNEEEVKSLTKFVIDVVLPTSSSNRALNRHFSTSMACVIYNEIVKKDLEFPPLLKKILGKIHSITVNGESYSNYKSGDALLWDINKDCNLVSISGGLLLKVTDREIDAVYEKDYNAYLSDAQKAILRLPIGKDENSLWVAGKRSSDIKCETYYANKGNDEESSLLQTKSGVWSTVMELDENVRAAAQVKRSKLIVVSSLVDKPPNLGGICRLCDCLGAGWMTVDDISVKENPEFKSVAVTADRWMPLIEVKIKDIIEFMRLKKKEGYTLIGLEQTDKSVELNSDLKFPEKSLILLGKEREGIPGDLLAELDMCVIIKQVGIVRSMNIQTATAVIVHAYSSQHC